jgi:hypothetical protein
LITLLLMSGCIALEPALRAWQVAQTRKAQPQRNLPPVTPPANSANAQADTPVDNSLLELLRFVPDGSSYRNYITYGDAAAWHAAWQIPRVQNLDEVEALAEADRARWLFALGQQTLPPEALGVQYLRVEEMRALYGFSFFDADRYLQAGSPPAEVTVVKSSAPPAQIDTALTNFGYQPTPLAEQGVLYSIRGDNEIDLQSSSLVGRLSQLNRIALLDDTLVIGRATPIVMRALEAHDKDFRSLADDPSFVALATALADPTLVEGGALVGIIMIGEPVLQDPLLLLDEGNTALQPMLEAYAAQPLPLYMLLGFATYRAPEATYLTLAVVFPPGTDTAQAEATLETRLQTYTSVVTQRPLDELWTVQQATSRVVNDWPVALVTMQVKEEEDTPGRVFAWSEMVFNRDLWFLIPGEPVVR